MANHKRPRRHGEAEKLQQMLTCEKAAQQAALTLAQHVPVALLHALVLSVLEETGFFPTTQRARLHFVGERIYELQVQCRAALEKVLARAEAELPLADLPENERDQQVEAAFHKACSQMVGWKPSVSMLFQDRFTELWTRIKTILMDDLDQHNQT